MKIHFTAESSKSAEVYLNKTAFPFFGKAVLFKSFKKVFLCDSLRTLWLKVLNSET